MVFLRKPSVKMKVMHIKHKSTIIVTKYNFPILLGGGEGWDNILSPS